ncbi:MAG TPA: DUF1552 domain-containing protein [Planctomycetaceae bacterium]|nr:DUF1552 domain-containing protein [Planctomycetaceae bacterium]
MTEKRLSRRAILKGMGTAIALPFLESLLPRVAFGSEAAAAALPPKRLAYLYVPNGVNMNAWRPATAGADYVLPQTLEGLQCYKDEMLVLSGLTLDKARPHGDGGGDHARSLSAYLTCSQARKTAGSDIKVGISADQLAAQRTEGQTKFPSLEIGIDAGAQSGNCDSGYSCAYSHNIAWRTESSPVAKEVNPRAVFERLFLDTMQSSEDRNRVRRQKYKKSVLDFVRDDADRLRKQLGGGDQRKVDEYLNAVRELEQRITRAETHGATPMPNVAAPAGIPKDYEEHLRLMSDMLVLAFQTDVTRISTFVFADEGSNRSYPFIEVREGHHDLSHHGNDEAKLAKIQKINAFHIAQLAYLLEKLKSVQEGEGTLLDNCMLVYGSGISDGNRHNHDDLPILVFGRGGGTLKPGRHIVFDNETPLANLHLSLLERFGVPLDKLGDSQGRLNLDA